MIGRTHGWIDERQLVTSVQRIAGDAVGATLGKVPSKRDWSTGVQRPDGRDHRGHDLLQASGRDVFPSLVGDRRFRILNIVDDHSRFCPGQIADISITGARLARHLDDLALLHGLPEEIVLDNGPERTSRAPFEWSERTDVRLRFIEPGKPVQNAFVESCNGEFQAPRLAKALNLCDFSLGALAA